MKKTKRPRIQAIPFNAESFQQTFGNTPLTLFSFNALDEELALLRKACAPAPDEHVPTPSKDHSKLRDIRYTGIQPVLNAQLLTPPSLEVARQALASTPVTERHLIQELIDLAWFHLRECRFAPMFLAPLRWDVRMALTVSGHLYPARVHHRDMKDLFPGYDP